MNGADIVIDVHGLTKKFDGRAVVRDLSMQVKRGTIYGFLGPNGSGKTTTIRMLCGLLTPDEGTGTCLGYDIRTETDKIKTQVGYMTQRFSLYQDLSVRENLEFIGRIYGIAQPRRRRARGDRAARPDRPRGADRRRAVGRLEAAAGARRLHAAEPATAAARRADRRRRSEGAARVLERDPRARRRRAHRAGLDPLHGRGRALSRDRLYRLWRTAGARHRRRGDRGVASDHLRRQRRPGRQSERAVRTARPASPASTWWRRSAPACTCPGATQAARGGDRALSQAQGSRLAALASPRSRTCSSI